MTELPCDCIQRYEGKWVHDCCCRNNGDLQRTVDWCTRANAAPHEAKVKDVTSTAAVVGAAPLGASPHAGAAPLLADYLSRLRNHPDHHLGIGDIRLTLAQQEEIINIAMRAECL